MASVMTLMKGYVKVAEAIKPLAENSHPEFSPENIENSDAMKNPVLPDAVLKNAPIFGDSAILRANQDAPNPVKALRLNMEKTRKDNSPLDLSHVTPSPTEFEGQSTEGRIGQCMG